MKRLLIYNYWLVIIAWCLFLNDYIILPMLLGLGGCAILVFMKRRFNVWRIGCLSMVIYITISFILSLTNIPYYFSKFYVFLAIVCLNLALTFERISLFKNKYLMPFLMTMIISMVILSIVAAIVPDSLYSLFTKNSLFLMINIIFLPQILAIVVSIMSKQIKKALNNKYLPKKLEIQKQRI